MKREQKIALVQAQLDLVNSNGDVDDLEQWKHQNEVAIRNALGIDNPTYKKLVSVKFAPSVYYSGMGNEPYISARFSGVRQSVALLKAAKGEIELVDPADEPASSAKAAPGGTRVFVVHGHDDVRKLEVASLVRDLTGVKATILSEYPNQGDTIIEKFERASSEAAFAVVIASADDLGARKSDEGSLSPRARQNVIFELGYFIGKLSRSRVALLVEEGVERPSDTDGIVYITLDPHGGWKLPLAKELNSAGVAVDFQALSD
ncbi:nucleotide-binding protein [Rhodococcus sp. PD04]|uniref:nucleotide-binding protein n=1 Tax=Rhodococcus sp. PD04 TaxID=3109594 RepID=UPI002DDBB68A|nr:nucleotide-binding protein [Rhodococcus sp. PD04]WSE23835.1 nucleotide-binding protein [Rhodococcus sp. PD04]